MKFIWNILALLIAFTTLKSHAVEVLTQVKEIQISEKIFEPVLIFLANGQVAKVQPDENELIQRLLFAKQEQEWLQFTINPDREITFAESASAPFKDDPMDQHAFEKTRTVESPSVLNSIQMAQRYFNYARFKHKESQCFNRAHVWSYEWKADNNLNTSKMFIFFSVKYIREHDFQWWFHVAPYVHVVIGTEIKERIMDKKYLRGPSPLREWIDTFMEDGTQCRTINLFSEYANYPESGECYLLRSSMYTYWPLDLEMEELNGTKKNNWVPEEIKQAYSEALEIAI